MTGLVQIGFIVYVVSNTPYYAMDRLKSITSSLSTPDL